MENILKFYYWFTVMGGDIAQIELANIHDIVNNVPLQVSSLKNRSAEIKEQYNYQFNFKNR